jgi:succinate-acetate transporter protein
MEVPLLLFVLGISIFLLAMNAWGMVPNEGYAPFALFTGGLGGLIVCVLAFRVGNPYAYVAAGAVGTFFASSAFYHWFFFLDRFEPGFYPRMDRACLDGRLRFFGARLVAGAEHHRSG